MTEFNLERCKYDFSSDVINVFVLLYDYSGSMDDDERAMKKANIAFYDDLSVFEEKGSIAVAKGRFASFFDMSSFDSIKNFDTSYHANGGTKLYYAIVKAKEYTVAYYNEIVKRLNVRPRITFLVFTDGGDNESQECYDDARAAITELNSLDATTVLVAFREAIKYGLGEKMGFSCTKDIESVEALITCMGTELSQSCKEQSRSAYSLKSEFFSQADRNSDEDNIPKQTIMDDDFFDL